jgi:hypothetical protein
MDNKQFLENHPIELSLLEKESEALRLVINEANESFIYDVVEKTGVKTEYGQYTDFYISCPTTTFAQAYFHFGILYAKYVIPIWNQRFKNNQTDN